MKQKVSFDFDGTLEFHDEQNYAKELVNRGIEVWIVTSRYEDTSNYSFVVPERSKNHKDLYDVAEKLNIPKERIHFTNMQYKSEFFKEQGKDFVWHLEDNALEIQLIKSLKALHNSTVQVIDAVYGGNWKEQ